MRMSQYQSATSNSEELFSVHTNISEDADSDLSPFSATDETIVAVPRSEIVATDRERH